MKKIIVLSDICFEAYKSLFKTGTKKVILKNINFEITENSITGLIGESGCGKTTLAKIIAGLNPPACGKVEIADKLNIQLLFQNSEESIHPFRKVIDILKDVSEHKEEILNTCALAGIEEKLFDQKGNSLSGGERQRVALARILLNKPDLIILDEPFSAQDPDSQVQLIRLLKEINSKFNCSLLVISHNIEPLRNLTKKIYVMLNGCLVEAGETSDVLSSPFHPYTDFLLKAESYNLKREDIQTNNDGTGMACGFYPTCKCKADNCKNEVLNKYLNGRMVRCNNPLTNEIL